MALGRQDDETLLTGNKNGTSPPTIVSSKFDHMFHIFIYFIKTYLLIWQEFAGKHQQHIH